MKESCLMPTDKHLKIVECDAICKTSTYYVFEKCMVECFLKFTPASLAHYFQT